MVNGGFYNQIECNSTFFCLIDDVNLEFSMKKNAEKISLEFQRKFKTFYTSKGVVDILCNAKEGKGEV